MTELDNTDRAVLQLEAQFWKRAGSKEVAIWELGLTVTAYCQRLNRLVDDPAAVLESPQLTRRLRDQRDRRTRARSPRRAG